MSGYVDRTVNVLLAGDDVSPQSIFLPQAENLESYVTRQLDADALLQQVLSSFRAA